MHIKVSKIISFVALFYGTITLFYAQDMQFTQFNAASLYLNPAFTGSTIQHRFASSYRNQWPGIPGNFSNYLFAYDLNLSELNSGVGVLFGREVAGTGNLGTTEVGLLYSYHFKINHKIYIQPGIKFNFVTRSIDFSKLIFNDQLASSGGATAEDVDLNSVSYVDITSGILAYSQKFWFGMAFNHINQPNQSLTQDESPLYMKFSTHGGYKFELPTGASSKETSYLNLIFQYKAQQKFDQLDLGFYYTRNPFVLGLWYRGIPLLKSTDNVLNQDALAIVTGYTFSEYNLSFGYSYDVTISKLFVNTAGSHEISIIYEVASKSKKRKRRKDFVPCAKF